jgi:hypothetical protein
MDDRQDEGMVSGLIPLLMNEYARPEGFIIFGNKQTFKLFTP